MTTKHLLLDRQRGEFTTGVLTLPGFKYDIGAQLMSPMAGEQATVELESTNDGFDWTSVATFTLDNATEVTASQVYIEADNVRARILKEGLVGAPAVTLWLKQVD